MDDLIDLESLPVEQLIEMIREKTGAGVNLSFPGKVLARQIGRRVRPRNQRTVKSLSAGDEHGRARNVLLEGDNLQALASLYRERGQVDMILTDPPYNTGGDFRYNDKWDKDPNDPDMGEFVGSDDPARHTKWMKFMYPRLQMMKAMLKPTGVLAICIDSRELFHLGQMLDELFHEDNRLAIINWQKITSPKNHDQGVSTATEYVLIYAKDEDKVRTGRLPRSEKTASGYVNPDSDPLGAWAPSDSTLMGASTHPGQVYGIQNPFTGKLHYPQEGRCWRNERAKMKAAAEAWGAEYEDRDLDDGLRPALVIKGARNPLTRDYSKDPAVRAAKKLALERRKAGSWPRYFWRNDRSRNPGHGELRYKTYLSDVEVGVVPTTYWASDEEFEVAEIDTVSWPHPQSGTSETGKSELNAVVGRGHGFDTVKPLQLMEKIISLWCPPGGLVLDPFAGSGTTGHAVLDLNKATGSDRRFILIEQGRPDNGDSYARTLTVDRLRRVIDGDWSKGAHEPLGGGFTFKKLEKKVDAKTLLLMERDEMIDTVIASHSSTGSRRRAVLIPVVDADEEPYAYLVAKNAANEGIFLVWSGADSNTDLTEEVYEEIAEEAEAAKLSDVYHVYSRRNLIVTDDVVWYQIPDRILSDFGLDVRSEPFTEEV
ncbi:adenine-specific DNA-methyltransferase [Gordonia malaquae]|uniref:Putative methyltransferase n=1 Tax=Gordonia malaquae NBRC 108250 TaxID=1223542 RepID=M3VBT6_GORML|nr:site-specific DNA-methyltransferase [Gordonia malaquae]GAC80828.1 putative methyltransferase [Gordonia malaquae NBRC 108250]SEB68188.1 adenine-specific DNA-methyltransferase [Gordonia malaquae]